MHSIVTTFREAVIKVEVANFGAAIDTLIDQDVSPQDIYQQHLFSGQLVHVHIRCLYLGACIDI